MNKLSMDTQTVGDLDIRIRQAIDEDLSGRADCTSQALFERPIIGSATLVARQAGRMCGVAVLNRIVEKVAPRLKLDTYVVDGESISARQHLAKLSGDARDILLVERTCLNFIGRLCGVATLTEKFVNAIRSTKARIFDTRKTTPGWRRLEKFAVRCGGGNNHRLGLHDAILIKDNHLAMLQQAEPAVKNVVALAIEKGRHFIAKHADTLPHGAKTVLTIEVENLVQLEQALTSHPNIVLLDNMNFESLRAAVELRDQLSPGVELEASGGINLQTVAAVAKTGVDRISVGAITHSAVNFDIGLEWDTR